MTFAAKETSRFSGQPVDLFYFKYGTEADAFYAYTDAEVPIEHAGITYQPISIKRGNITASGTLDKASLSVNCPINAGIAELFRVYPPGQVVSVILRQGHLSDPDAEYLVVWSGRIIQCKRDGSEATLTCEPIATSMRRSGLRRNYQLSCPHVLYGSACKANKGVATISSPVITVAGVKITMQDAWSGLIDPVKYIGGIVEWSAVAGLERRTILRVTISKILTLSGPTTGIVAGNNVSISLGCNHQAGVGPQPNGDCLPLHNNIQNFGGDPWIPTSNPINTNPFS